MKNTIKKVVVLGAGTMGAQVAAHAASKDLEVVLLDMVPKGAEDRTALARGALERMRKLKPSPYHLPEHRQAIRPGNFEDDWKELADADWIFEAVIEDLAIKRSLLAKVQEVIGKDALLTTNTSGLPIASMSDGLDDSLASRFFGTHFFNPPRYLKLLETIPGPKTDAGRLERFEAFADRVLGKGVVRCKDTPNFIANRIGSYSFGVAMKAMVDMDLSIEAVDTLTGPAIGRARSATFRTGDIAGVDVLAKVAQNLYDAVPDDPERELFLPPKFVGQMLEKGWLGQKSGSGFYRKQGKEIEALDWKTLEYRARQKVKYGSLEAAKTVEDVAARLRQILAGKDEAADFLWRVLSGTCLYAAAQLPAISDDVTSVDRAMEWGYGWGFGPFRLFDALGVKEVVGRAREEGRTIPKLAEELLKSGRKSFYETEPERSAFGPTGVTPLPARDGVIELTIFKASDNVVKKNAGASLVDIGDGCGLIEFHSKMNSLGPDAIQMLHTAAREASQRFDALVVGNQGENFTVGANLMLVLLAVQEEEWDELDLMIRQFQGATMAIKYADVPVVAAPFGMALGGGCEVSLHSDRVRASAETYMGLVEVGVGVVPAGGGTKEMALRAADRCSGVPGADVFPFLQRAFETIAFAKVSTSGAEALGLYLTPADSLSPNPDRLIGDAKQVSLGLARAGYRPARPRRDIAVLGTPALATFEMAIHNALRGGQISDHDAVIGRKVAAILCGGNRQPGLASEQDLLDLEREAFLSLLGMPKTQERIQHTLKTGKPLRN